MNKQIYGQMTTLIYSGKCSFCPPSQYLQVRYAHGCMLIFRLLKLYKNQYWSSILVHY